MKNFLNAEIESKHQKTEIIKEGLSETPDHKCTWISESKSKPYNGVIEENCTGIEYNQICSICGCIERIVEITKYTTYEDVYNKFHGERSNV